MFLQLKPSYDEQSSWKRAQGPARVPPAPGKAQFGVPRQPPTLCAPHRGLLSPGCICTHPCEWVFLGGGDWGLLVHLCNWTLTGDSGSSSEVATGKSAPQK